MIKLNKAKTLLAILSLIPTVGSTSESTDNLRYLLDTTDCAAATQDRAFNVHAMNKYFPLQKGYDFYGYELGRLSFRKLGSSPQIQSRSEIDSAANEYSQQMASVTYYELEQPENLEDAEHSDLEELNWRDFSLLYHRSEHVASSSLSVWHNQVIVRMAGESERLMLSSFNLKNITDVIACASDERI